MSAHELEIVQSLAAGPTRVDDLEANQCSVTLRRVNGPLATELYFSCSPPSQPMDAGQQAEAIYRAVRQVLDAEGGDVESLVSETLFVRDMAANIEPVRAARRRTLACGGDNLAQSVVTEIEQPPLDESACVEVSVQAVISKAAPLQATTVSIASACGCTECASVDGLQLQVGDEVRLLAGGICGMGQTAYEQTRSMFELADRLLQQAGMEFNDVVRTWIYLRHMERDYGHLNRARREFFESRGVSPVPASTGIEGGAVSQQHDLCLSLYAVKGGRSATPTVMTSPTLNEAAEYGADFVRGIRMEESNRVSLHVSGTASIDEEGRTAHVGDFDAQADRMLVNIAALLERQGASFDDIVSAVSYLKHPEDANRLREKFIQAGFVGFPNVLVKADVCRPDLLCETEVLAVLPQSCT